MTRSHHVLAAVAGITALGLAAAACSSSSGGSAAAPVPGVTAHSITIGSHQPLTGIAAYPYAEIAPAANAYFAYVNAHGGVYGRKIIYKYLDDGYNPSKTVGVITQLVTQDNVFAIFNGLGTPTHLAVVKTLNQQKIPDVFVATGCSCFQDGMVYPYTFGWQLNYVREGKILGTYVKQHFAGKKIGYFYQGDDFGLNGVKGLDYVIPSKSVVAREPYNVAGANPAAEVGAAVAKLKAAGAQVIVSFSVPAFTALLRLTEATLKFNPTNVVSDVGSDPTTLATLLNNFAKKKGAFGTALTQGIITDGYLPPLGVMTNPWVKLAENVLHTYAPKLPLDGNSYYGVAVAYTFVQALVKAGKNLTRPGLIKAIESGIAQGFSVAPYLYNAADHVGMTGAYMAVISGSSLKQLGGVLTTDTTPTGAVTALSGSQPAPPANGIP
jgi:ABC-type branched-subunit amino acid transport system substrate-binding protein